MNGEKKSPAPHKPAIDEPGSGVPDPQIKRRLPPRTPPGERPRRDPGPQPPRKDDPTRPMRKL